MPNIVRLVFCFLTLTILSACSDLSDQWRGEWLGRYGPDPLLNAKDVGPSVNRQKEALLLYVEAARSPVIDPTTKTIAASDQKPYWYEVVLTAFNDVDDRCTRYFEYLWIMDRQRGRVKDSLVATGAATAVITAATGHPSAQALAVIASAFGLAGALTDTVALSYLYSQPPSTLLTLWRKTRDAYRTTFAEEYAAPKSRIPMGTPAAAYYHIREYLSLCLPPTLQSQIDEYLSKAKGTTEGSSQSKEIAKAKDKSGTAVQKVVIKPELQ